MSSTTPMNMVDLIFQDPNTTDSYLSAHWLIYWEILIFCGLGDLTTLSRGERVGRHCLGLVVLRNLWMVVERNALQLLDKKDLHQNSQATYSKSGFSVMILSSANTLLGILARLCNYTRFKCIQYCYYCIVQNTIRRRPTEQLTGGGRRRIRNTWIGGE